MTWRGRIACATDDGTFNTDFEIGSSAKHAEHSASVNRAIAICRSCPVQAECLKDMLSYDEAPYRVVVAGMRPQEARVYWYRVNRDTWMTAQCGTEKGYSRHRAAGEDACQPCKTAASRARWNRNPKNPKNEKETA